MRMRLSAVVLLMTCAVSAQQAGTANSATGETGQAANPAPVVLRAGEPVELVAAKGTTSERAKLGDKITFEVRKPVKIGDLVVVPEHTAATATVTDVKARGHKGAPGSMTVSFDAANLVTGSPVGLQGAQARQGADKRAQVSNDAGSMVFETLGFGLPIVPVVLLQKGGSVRIERGMRMRASIAQDVSIDRAFVEQHQPRPRNDLAIVYLIGGWHATCGGMPLPFDLWTYPAGVVRLELPPATYWFHTGATISFGGGLKTAVIGGFSYGLAMPDPVSMRKVLQRPKEEFLPLSVEGGKTYFLRAKDEGPRVDRHHRRWQCESGGTCLHLLDAEEGEKVVDGMDGFYYRMTNLADDVLRTLQSEPQNR